MDSLAALTEALPSIRLSTAEPDRLFYSRDCWPKQLISLRQGELPAQARAVAWPACEDELATLIEVAAKEGIPLVPFGAGSGVCGGVLPNERTVVVDLKRLNQHTIVPDAPLVHVGAGAMGLDLEAALGRQGFSIGHYPSSILCSTIGGWVAARGAGQCSGRYGKIEDMLVGARVVLGDGSVTELKWRQNGPNLLPLLIGSEGCFGAITRVSLRLNPAPQRREFSAFSFPSLSAAWDALRLMFQCGLRPAVSRLYDPLDSALLKLGAVKPHSAGTSKPGRSKHQWIDRSRGWLLRTSLGQPGLLNRVASGLEGQRVADPVLILVFEGEAAEVREDHARAKLICRNQGGNNLGAGPAERWFAHRYSVSYRQSPVFRAGAFSDTFEVAAPWSKLSGVYQAVREALSAHALIMAHFSHAYPDGCSIYFTFVGARKSDAVAQAAYLEAWNAAMQAALQAGATLSHHHGIGRSKASSLAMELGQSIGVLRSLKDALDPKHIMNPGVLFEPVSAGLPESSEPVRVRKLEERLSVDRISLLAEFDASISVDEAQNLLYREGLCLGLEQAFDTSISLDAWAGSGLLGLRDPFADPVEQRIAGWEARLHSGIDLHARPVPRRATGPDLLSLFLGAHGECGHFRRLCLRVYPSAEASRGQGRAHAFVWDRNPQLLGSERALWERLKRALS